MTLHEHPACPIIEQLPPEASSPPGSSDSADSFASATSALTPHVDPSTEDLRDIFDHFDENKDGKISRDEMSRSLDRLGLAVLPDELTTLIDTVDLNSDGFVDYSEFVSMYDRLIKGKLSSNTDEEDDASTSEDADLKRAFQVFDKDRDGFITAEELHSVLSSMGILKGKTLRDCVKMISRVDTDGNGRVDFEEFKLMMASGGG